MTQYSTESLQEAKLQYSIESPEKDIKMTHFFFAHFESNLPEEILTRVFALS